MTESEVIDKTALVFGQMNEPPGARLRVGLSGLTMAEYFREQGQDVLLFIDNIFRFVQAGSEVSALLGRMPSAVGYQPTLATEMGQLQERITSTRRARSRRSRRSTCPADDLTDPAPANTFAHLDATTDAEPGADGAGHLSGRRPARLGVADHAAGRRLGRALPRRRRASRRSSSATRSSRTSSPSSGWRSSRTRTRSSSSARGRSSASSRSRSSSPSSSPARRASSSRLDDTIRGFTEILEGKHDELPEGAFYMVGTIEEAVERGREMAGDEDKKSEEPKDEGEKAAAPRRTRSPPRPSASPSPRPRRPSASPGDTRPLLGRDHTAPGTTLALAKATGLGRGRVRLLAWCSRPRS